MDIKLLKLRRALNTYLVKARMKVLYDRLQSRGQIRSFRKMIDNGVVNQAKRVITIENLKEILNTFSKLSDNDSAKVKSALKKVYKPVSDFIDEKGTLQYLVWSGNEGGIQAAKLLGAGGQFNLKNSALKNQLEKRSTWIIDSLNESNFESLRVAITEGIERDLIVADLRDNIVSKISDEISPYRAEMVTRTEFANAATMVAQKTYTKNGVEQWEWIYDGGDCEICAPNDGEVRTIGDSFPSGDDRPPAHPNCICDLIPQLPKDFDASDAWLGE